MTAKQVQVQPRYISPTEAAATIGCNRYTITRHCQRHGIGDRVGRSIVLTPDDVERLRGLVRPGPGNPTFGREEMGDEGTGGASGASDSVGSGAVDPVNARTPKPARKKFRKK